MQNEIKIWRTVIEAVDINTGEIIKKSEVERGEYLILNKTITYKVYEKTGERRIQWNCKRNNQLEIWK